MYLVHFCFLLRPDAHAWQLPTCRCTLRLYIAHMHAHVYRSCMRTHGLPDDMVPCTACSVSCVCVFREEGLSFVGRRCKRASGAFTHTGTQLVAPAARVAADLAGCILPGLPVHPNQRFCRVPRLKPGDASGLSQRTCWIATVSKTCGSSPICVPCNRQAPIVASVGVALHGWR